MQKIGKRGDLESAVVFYGRSMVTARIAEDMAAIKLICPFFCCTPKAAALECISVHISDKVAFEVEMLSFEYLKAQKNFFLLIMT